MLHSKKSIAQLIINACETNNITKVVISPGSRNAPLTIGFHNNSTIEVLSVVDERSAAFFALGIAQQTQEPVALLCTSGSALLNYYPAIAEAYFSNIPLIILSADRPKYLQNIGDGQTINQKNVFKNHILMSANLIENNNEKTEFSLHNFNLVQKTILKSITKSRPVHINIPFDEPLYETTTKAISFPKIKTEEPLSLLDEIPLNVDELDVFAKTWNTAKKKMVLIGVNSPLDLIQTQINHILEDESVLVLTETTSNLYHTKIINGIDKLISPLSKKELNDLKPDILLTFGGMIVSKKIKQFIRNHQPKHHWHVDKYNTPDTFFCLSHHFKVSASLFFSQFFFLTKNTKSLYQKKHLTVYESRKEKHELYLKNAPYSDLKVFSLALKSVPKNYNLQLSNSSIIRYSQLFDIKKSVSVYCNRGTSGIDGSTSTAIGASYASDKKTLFITGDLSFFYDSNALWNKYIKKDFRIILINNSGGGIFRFIPGPQTTNALELFETPHQLTAAHLCKMHGLSYATVSSIEDSTKKLKSFFNASSKPKLLEITTPRDVNDVVLKAYFESLK
ncbi:MAG: 2-succinyl-5-enolpyruvyl-6-hydroxy-3-cyclohexene-1-carboxylic-acid synthase [Flavobacteriaceae bacterium]